MPREETLKECHDRLDRYYRSQLGDKYEEERQRLLQEVKKINTAFPGD
jgi:hypothetical protein